METVHEVEDQHGSEARLAGETPPNQVQSMKTPFVLAIAWLVAAAMPQAADTADRKSAV